MRLLQISALAMLLGSASYASIPAIQDLSVLPKEGLVRLAEAHEGTGGHFAKTEEREEGGGGDGGGGDGGEGGDGGGEEGGGEEGGGEEEGREEEGREEEGLEQEGGFEEDCEQEVVAQEENRRSTLGVAVGRRRQSAISKRVSKLAPK